MEVIREVRKVKDREVTIKLPDYFNDTEVEILIRPIHKDSFETDDENKIEKDLIEALEEVKMMREGKLLRKTAEEFFSEL